MTNDTNSSVLVTNLFNEDQITNFDSGTLDINNASSSQLLVLLIVDVAIS